jgi:phage shock protein PspC (stress-responsive transcriptional regulator)
MLGGVAAGIARAYGLDVTLLRILWVVAAVLWVGIPAYVVAWIAIPADDAPGATDRPRDAGVIAGLVLVGIGMLIVGERLVFRRLHGELVGPVLLVAGGVAILWLRRPGPPGGAAADEPVAAAVPSAEAGETGAAPGTETIGTAAAGPETSGAAAPGTATGAVPATTSAWTQSAPWPTAPPPREVRRRRRERPRPFLTPLTLSLLMIGAGVASGLHATGVVDVDLTSALAVATCVVGAVLVVSAWFGRARGLIAVGLLLVCATAAASVLDVPLRGGVGEEIHRPREAGALPTRYEHAIGHLVVDLRDLALEPGRPLAVRAQLGIGQLEVRVRDDVRVVARGHAGAGALSFFGHHTGGWDHGGEREAGPPDSDRGLDLDLRVGAGEVRVRRFAGDVELVGGSR